MVDQVAHRHIHSHRPAINLTIKAVVDGDKALIREDNARHDEQV